MQHRVAVDISFLQAVADLFGGHCGQQNVDRGVKSIMNGVNDGAIFRSIDVFGNAFQNGFVHIEIFRGTFLSVVEFVKLGLQNCVKKSLLRLVVGVVVKLGVGGCGRQETDQTLPISAFGRLDNIRFESHGRCGDDT